MAHLKSASEIIENLESEGERDEILNYVHQKIKDREDIGVSETECIAPYVVGYSLPRIGS